VGDSRCYLLRGDRLSQLTTDHTVAQKLVEDGTLEPEEARASRYNSVLWNALGGGVSELQPQVIRATLRPADTLVLCSDGLTAHVPDDRIRDILAEDRSAQDASAELVRLANEGGGQDNITVVVARVGGDRVVKTPLEFSAVDTQTIEIPWSTLAAG
ncbi:MAG: serine/threonine-protein phosphatase, partial [Planctomycetes bacterium]|nr:serine/threonine-protein phosphatase [Planctomycetota bacterium]